MKKIKPKLYDLPAFKRLEKEWTKPPEVRVMPINTKEDRKKAKLMEKVLNHAFKTNANGITNKYMQVMKLASDNFLAEELYGIRTSWDATMRVVENIAKQEKKVVDE